MLRASAVVACAIIAVSSSLAGAAVRDANDATSETMPTAPPLPPSFRVSWPLCSDLANGFGYRVDPFTGRMAFHAGLDIAADIGTPVRAALGGAVLAAEARGPYGNMVEIDHGSGVKTRYGHLDSIGVKAGERVAEGDAIGRSGQSGRSMTPHLHFEVWYYDVVRDPLKSLPPIEACVVKD